MPETPALKANRPEKVKVLGVGGGGVRAINHVSSTFHSLSQLQGDLEFWAVDTDGRTLSTFQSDRRLQLGDTITRGFGTNGDPAMGLKAAVESREIIRTALEGSDLVIIVAGLGGGTGTVAAAVIAEVAREIGAVTIGCMTRPLAREGLKYVEQGAKALEDLHCKVDSLVVIPMDELFLPEVEKYTVLWQTYEAANDALGHCIEALAHLCMMGGLISVDLSDIRSVLRHAPGYARFGLGVARGDARAFEAARRAINSPMLGDACLQAPGIIFFVHGGSDITLHEVNDAADLIYAMADKESNIIFGAQSFGELHRFEERYSGEICVSIIAAGFQLADVC